MKVLVLEYTVGLKESVDSRLFPEGFGMLRTMVNEFKEAGFEVITTLHEDVSRFEDWIEADEIYREDELDEALSRDPDAVLPIAPEGELERITRRVKEGDIPVLGAEEGSIAVSKDKWSTYRALRGSVLQPTTWREPPSGREKVVKKLRVGESCSGMELVDSAEFSASEDLIYQELVRGDHASACLLAREGEVSVLSINEQNIIQEDGEFDYGGGKIPYQGVESREFSDVASRAAEKLNLSGFCGFDFVIEDSLYFIESNPRITTSFIGLPPILGGNLGRMIVDALIENEPLPSPDLEGVSAIKIPRVKEKAEIETENLDELREIPGIVSPPFAPDGYLREGSTIFMAVGWGDDQDQAEMELEGKMRKATRLLGVEDDAVAWS